MVRAVIRLALVAMVVHAGVKTVPVFWTHFKFRDAVERATGNRPALPARVGDLFQREERCVDLPGDYAAVADYVASHATPKG